MITHATNGPTLAADSAAYTNARDGQPIGSRFGPAIEEIVFSTWWRGDQRPVLAPLDGLEIEFASDYGLVAELARLDVGEVRARARTGHRPYLARIGATPVAYGWSAVAEASIGEIGLAFEVPAGNRYLWDFATLPAWRGLGVYPRLLQTILEREERGAGRFWIGHMRENTASGRGIAKAGFHRIGSAVRDAAGTILFVTTGPGGRAAAGAAVLGLGGHTRQAA